MTAQLLFYAVILGLAAFFKFTPPAQRRKAFGIAVWVVVAFGALGFIAEMAMRGGGLPISW
jgi:hypothetical protein